jgi:hypothetical protein
MKWYPNKERGQVLVLFSLMLVVFIGVLALVLDGGMGYLYRRQAQNAADAAALAASELYCRNTAVNGPAAILRAKEYGEVYNGADKIEVEITPAIREVKATATKSGETFFASILNHSELTAIATASSRCFTPALGEGVLPMGFPCRPTVTGSHSADCGIKFGPGEMVLFADSGPTNGLCAPDGTINCDLNNDNIRDLYFSDGDRGWLDLDGSSSSASELSGYINNGYTGPPLRSGLWVGGQTGVANSVWQDAKSLEGKSVLIPIFNTFCDGLPASKCPSSYKTGDETRLSNGQLYYRIAGTARLHITCVKATGSDSCPFRTQAGYTNDNNSVKSIEGYFVQDTGSSGTPGDSGVDFGVYLIRLSK